MFKAIFSFFFPNWQAIGSHPLYFFDPDSGTLLYTMSATYYMGRFERRKVAFDSGRVGYEHRHEYQPKNHPLFHTLVVPYLRKVGDFGLPNYMVSPIIQMFCASVAPTSIKGLFKGSEQADIKKLSDRAGSNVIPFAPINKNEPPNTGL